ncbi:hypothetical protein B9Y63_11805 [Stenotrophomonas maltophilia]|nr:hypothetical protein B9Y63_11805 [Stenotrophomonas maltophilia]PJL41909.1 hypothetical protein B9Y56_14135 [Stenotrophomonas maltophilia]
MPVVPSVRRHGGDVTLAPVIKHSLSVEEDREAIERFELTHMRGSHDLQDRPIRHFITRVDRDDLKFEVFPDLWPDRQALSPLTRRLPEWLR